ncbi:MAG TPA: hypothetical protein VFX53_17070 [Pedococcus sp.]|nr:hypothetical protein [Pedococcus sp.]
MTAPTDSAAAVYTGAVPALYLVYANAMARIRERLAQLVSYHFRRSGQWRDRDAQAFVRAIVPLVAGAQQAVSAITAGYLHDVARELTGTPSPPSGVSPSRVTGSAVRTGVDPVVVYQRPYHQVWTDLAAGTPLDEAVDKAERRVLTIANTDLQLAKTHTAKEVFDGDKAITYYRRIPQGPHTCAMCLIVSTRRYHKKDLAAIHPNCDCGIEQVYADVDPGPVLDEDFLNAIHDAIERDLGKDYVADSGKAGSTAKRELNYRDIIITHQHGEIGPVLGVRAHKFTGPDGIKRLNFTGPKDTQLLSHSKIPEE